MLRKLLERSLGRSLGDNSWYLMVEIFWASIYASSQAFNGAFAIRLGASNTAVSLLSSIPALMAALIMMPAARFLESRQRRKQWLLGSLFAYRAGILLFVLVPFLHISGISQGTLFVIVVVLWTAPAHFFNLGFIPFLSQAVKPENRADVFSIRNALMGAMLALFTFLFGKWLVTQEFPTNYQAMFLVGFAFSLLSLYYLSKVNVSEVPRVSVSSAAGPFWKSLVQQWLALRTGLAKVPGFRQIIINTFLHSLGLWLAAPLYTLYFIRGLNAGEAWLGLFGSIGSLTTIFGFLFWRRFIARRGEPRTLQLTIVLIGVYPLLVGAIPHLTVILIIAALNGLITPGVSLSHFNVFLKLIPDEQRHEYTALYMTLMNVGAFVCPFIGVALADTFGFAPVLVVCGLLSIVGSMSFWFWPVHGPAEPGGAPAAASRAG
jgi:MFS family permease